MWVRRSLRPLSVVLLIFGFLEIISFALSSFHFFTLSPPGGLIPSLFVHCFPTAECLVCFTSDDSDALIDLGKSQWRIAASTDGFRRTFRASGKLVGGNQRWMLDYKGRGGTSTPPFSVAREQ